MNLLRRAQADENGRFCFSARRRGNLRSTRMLTPVCARNGWTICSR